MVSETVFSSKSLEKETSTGSDEGTASPNCTLPNMPNEQNNSVISFIASAEVSEDQKLDNTKPPHSSLAYDNRSTYSSPVGLVSICDLLLAHCVSYMHYFNPDLTAS